MRTLLRSARLARIPHVGRRYADVLTMPGASAFFLAAVPARVGVAMTSLGLLWLVRWGTDSYAAAGIVSGVFAVTSALTAPLFGRLAARFSQSRVLVPTAIMHAGAVGATVVAVAAHCPLWTIVLAGVVAGAALPPVASLTATRWSVLLAGSSLLPTAFAVESLSNELAYLFGPALVGTVSAVVVAPAGAVLAAGLVLLGCLALARQRATDPRLSEPPPATNPRPSKSPPSTNAHLSELPRGPKTGPSKSPPSTTAPLNERSRGANVRLNGPPRSTDPRLSKLAGGVTARLSERSIAAEPELSSARSIADRRSTRAGGRFAVLAAVNLGIGFFFGALQVAVTAFATEHGVAGSTGLIYSILSVTSLIAGFAYGARKWRLAAPRQLIVALALLTACSVPMMFTGSPWMLAIALLLPGFGLAPSMIVVSLLAERVVPKAALTRAFAMLNSAGAVGTALASAIAGRLVDGHGAGWGFGVAVGAVGLATVVASSRCTNEKSWWPAQEPATSPAVPAGQSG